MEFSEAELLRQLGTGRSIDSVCRDFGLTRAQFDEVWATAVKRRLSQQSGEYSAPVSRATHIYRDERGIPHIVADNDADLFFSYGYAMAADRLFQLDYLRRKGSGRLAEILGEPAVETDLLARTIGLRHIAQARWESLPAETRDVLTAFTAGINAHIEAAGDNLPIEFALLDYHPEPWCEVDSLTIEVEFQWYLTGRFPVIAIPELVKRQLGDGPLYEDFLLGEADDEAILPPEAYANARPGKLQSVGAAQGYPFEAHGSNNWVLAGNKTVSGKPLLASDPHIAFEAVSCWYEAHLCGGSYNVTGMTYVGMPAIMFGQNEQVAWGCTNNICSQRDLYQERTDPDHPGAFLYDGRWEPARELEETIVVKNAQPLRKKIRFSRNGPIVDEILPAAARKSGPVSIRWLGRHHGGWLTALLGMNRAGSIDELFAASEPWHVPTFAVVAADQQGHIGFRAVGRIPQRNSIERGYRPGWDPEQQWTGLIPFEGMPHWTDPERGWVCTANNRVAADDFPYPLFGTWSSCHRAHRIRQMIEAKPQLSRDDMAAMQVDSLSLRAVECVPPLLAIVEGQATPALDQAVWVFRDWNCRCEPDEIGPTLFNAFFTNWCRTVASERFDGDIAEFVAGSAGGIASRLLAEDRSGWFQRGTREEAVVETLLETMSQLSEKLGPDITTWRWERWHRLPLVHVLSQIGELGELLNHGDVPAPGDMTTVGNTGYGPDGRAITGGGYRLIADLSEPAPVLFAQDAQSQSGQPGSPHYSDQLGDWLSQKYHRLPLARPSLETAADSTFTLTPLS
mgnify:CR=1 FL=1